MYEYRQNLDDHRKVIAARRSEINKEWIKIPVRIDEANRPADISVLREGAPAAIKRRKASLVEAGRAFENPGGGEIAEEAAPLAESRAISAPQNEHQAEQNKATSKVCPYGVRPRAGLQMPRRTGQGEKAIDAIAVEWKAGIKQKATARRMAHCQRRTV